ncbi:MULTISPECIES: hypothetical protein [Mycobacterium avium complex (MAC)]|uniref:Uncharacterized protein n=1 Tax=Mycobacterium intracellulare TaxID=1767 RepID=A0AAE4RHU2_MYCIT|nr:MULTISPECIES: hypothetical protein [Mycobacterium avium complex (MAC)]MBG0730400.1 hypothetical protein [Mycobacterium avium]MCA2235086.1 hypothetical protein [Mycobacterium intracellulare]MCA2260952.1 hypothetical protein [Mycobacterium avium]MCA2322753.1 hypothetical protein [Mycobacterium intracellulare]MCA2343275.1 hypothetical protein [Mycobacterium intracellulare]
MFTSRADNRGCYCATKQLTAEPVRCAGHSSTKRFIILARGITVLDAV